jgi:hypothetical protein
MNTNKKTARILEDVKINVKMKLSALWIAAMFCYLYADVKAFYMPGFIEQIISGEVAGFQITQGFLLGSAIIMVIPAVMVFLSLTLKAKANRWTNIILGIIYTGIILMTMLMPGDGWAYYYVFAIVEVVLTSLIVWYAWMWPKQEINPKIKEVTL